jgi:hypothetical protein
MSFCAERDSCARAGLEAVFNEVRISAQEIECGSELRGSEDSPEKPGLPEMKSPGPARKARLRRAVERTLIWPECFLRECSYESNGLMRYKHQQIDCHISHKVHRELEEESGCQHKADRVSTKRGNWTGMFTTLPACRNFVE